MMTRRNASSRFVGPVGSPIHAAAVYFGESVYKKGEEGCRHRFCTELKEKRNTAAGYPLWPRQYTHTDLST